MPPPEGMRFAFGAVMSLQIPVKKHVWFDEVRFKTLTGDVFTSLCMSVMRALDLEGDASWEAVVQSLNNLYGGVYTDEVCNVLVWRLAAGAEWLKQGCAIEGVFRKVPPHWAPILIEDCQYVPRNQMRDETVKVFMRVLGGRFAGLPFSQKWPYRYHVHVVAKELGFPLYETSNYRELTRMRMVGLLDTSNLRYVSVVEVFGSSGAKNYNKKLMKLRATCHFGYKWACYQCSLGYTGTKSCSHATHSQGFEQRPCSRCSKTDAWFDPASDYPYCLSCLAADKRRSSFGG